MHWGVQSVAQLAGMHCQGTWHPMEHVQAQAKMPAKAAPKSARPRPAAKEIIGAQPAALHNTRP